MTQPLRTATSLACAGIEAAAHRLSCYPADLGAGVRELAEKDIMQNDQLGPAVPTDMNPNGQSFDSKFTDLVIRLIVVGFFAYLSLTLLAHALFAIVQFWK
jgi:hypothetical protein